MHSDFWHNKWQNQEIGFHLEDVNPLLIKYWPKLELAQGSRVLVPLCGKTVDILWLLQQGYQVVGAELSEIALTELARHIEQQLGIEISHSTQGDMQLFKGEGVQLFCGDFFQLTPEQVGTVDAIYDRAALVALPKPMRDDYSRHVMSLTQQAPQLLVTLEYDQNQKDGPPFAIPQTEISRLYGNDYGTELLLETETIQDEPRFQAAGLTSFIERVNLLSPRS